MSALRQGPACGSSGKFAPQCRHTRTVETDGICRPSPARGIESQNGPATGALRFRDHFQISGFCDDGFTCKLGAGRYSGVSGVRVCSDASWADELARVAFSPAIEPNSVIPSGVDHAKAMICGVEGPCVRCLHRTGEDRVGIDGPKTRTSRLYPAVELPHSSQNRA